MSICLTLILVSLHLNIDHQQILQPASLGAIHWEKDFTFSRQRSLMEGKPLFILFTSFQNEPQAVEFGRTVFRNPLIQEAIETEFIPLAIDNKQGQAEAFVYFREPYGNLPVIRIFDPSSQVPAERLAGNYSASAVAVTMIIGLSKKGIPAPTYLKLLAKEDNCELHSMGPNFPRPYGFLPMTLLQEKWVEKSISRGGDPKQYLSPRQKYIVEKMLAEPDITRNQEVRKLAKMKAIVELEACLRKKGPPKN